MCDAEALCFVNGAQFPVSSFTLPPLYATRPWYFLNFFSPIRSSWDDTSPLLWQKCTSLPSNFARRITSALLFSVSCPKLEVAATGFPFFVDSGLCLNSCHCSRYVHRFMHHVVVRHGNITSAMSVSCTLFYSNPLRFYVSPHDLSWKMKSATFSCPLLTNQLHSVVSCLKRSGWLVWFTLQGIAEALGISNFLMAILTISS